MTNAAKSIIVHGIYLLIQGGMLLIIPNIPLKIFGLAETTEIWIRVIGMMSLVLGYYFIKAARKEDTDFFRSTILTRTFAVIIFIVFVVLGLGPINLLLLIAIDPVFILWTAWALRSVPSVKSGLAQKTA